MTWTYSGDPASSDKDAVRWLCGDTVSTNPLAQDEEIAYALANFGGTIHAAAVTCEAISGRFASGALTSKKVGSLALGFANPAESFAARAKELRRLIGTDLAEIFVGGLTIDEKETLGTDEGAVQPAFSRGQDDAPGTRDRGFWPKRFGDW